MAPTGEVGGYIGPVCPPRAFGQSVCTHGSEL